MKKYVLICLMAIMQIFSFAQTTNDSLYVDDYFFLEEEKQVYFELGLGGFIPTDKSNSYFGTNIEIGAYMNKYYGLGILFKYGSENEFNDRLGYIGPNVRFRINRDPRNDLDLDIHLGVGYGFYSYNLYDDYYYTNYKNYNFIVPNFGLSGYVNINKNISIGIEPSYFWYISTNKNDISNVGVWNFIGKLKLTF